ncbi:MFS transporter [Calidifontibacter indicus]|uniref:MFS transporter n=1 Tax=Calidifontibacter indicus TaxID=419650 RepID=UPI003D745F98
MSHAAAPVRSRRPAGLITAVLAITGTLVALQQTLVVPLLPEVPKLLHTTETNGSWLVTATLLASAVATPIVSRCADMFGKRKMMLISLATMIVGSLIGALGHQLWQVILGRSLQGFAAALVPVGISIMRDELPREKVGGAVALMSATLGIGAAIGLPLSGYIYAHFDWHALFWVSLVAAIVMFLAIVLVVPESAVRTHGRFDVVGALLLSSALICFLLAVSKGGDWGWGSRTTLGLFVAAVVIAAAWVPWELRTVGPMVDLRTAARPPILLTNIASVFVGLSMFVNLVSTTQLLQMPKITGYGHGLSVLDAGLCVLPAGLMMVVLSPVTATITKRWGGKYSLLLGGLVLGLSYVLRVYLTGSVFQIALGAAITSAGTAIAYAAMPSIIMANAPISETAAANGFNALLRAVGTSTSSAMVAAILSTVAINVGGIDLPRLEAFHYIYWVAAAAGLVAALVAFFIPSSRREDDPQETHSGRDVVVHGHVRDGSGRPARNAVVTLLTDSGEKVDWSRAEADGSYSLVLPGPGVYQRITNADGYHPRAELVSIDAAGEYAVELGTRFRLEGTVRLDGHPVDGALVTITTPLGEVEETGHTQADGSFSLRLDVTGRHVVSVIDPATSASSARHVVVLGAVDPLTVDLVRRPSDAAPTVDA